MPTYSERTAGIYRCRYIGWSDLNYVDKETGEDQHRWVWRFQELADPTTVGQIDKITGTSLASPNSNAYKMAAGIVGHKLQPGDDTEKHVGELYDVVYGPNQAGNLTIVSVVRVSVEADNPILPTEAEKAQTELLAAPPAELP